MRVCSRPECTVDISEKECRQKYCSRKCAAIVNNAHFPKRKKQAKERTVRKTGVQKWLDGEWDGNTKYGLSQPIRRYLLAQAEYTCQDGRSGCNGWGGYNERSGKSCLTVDHLNGDSTDHRPENLRIMCPNCHSMTPTYGALNKGKGRKYRYVDVG